MSEPRPSSSQQRRRTVFLIAGVLLIIHPFVVPVGELASPDPVYERTELTMRGPPDWERGTAAVAWHGLDCIEDPGDRRRCVLEQGLVNASLTVSAYEEIPRDEPYVALFPFGYYERTYEETDSGTRYNLTRVSGRTVLRHIAVSPAQAPPELAPAARGGVATPESRITETYVIRDNGDFFLITRTDTRSLPLSELYGPLSATGFVLGATLLVRSGRAFDSDR